LQGPFSPLARLAQEMSGMLPVEGNAIPTTSNPKYLPLR
jgi:hypothetical protein